MVLHLCECFFHPFCTSYPGLYGVFRQDPIPRFNTPAWTQNSSWTLRRMLENNPIFWLGISGSFSMIFFDVIWHLCRGLRFMPFGLLNSAQTSYVLAVWNEVSLLRPLRLCRPCSSKKRCGVLLLYLYRWAVFWASAVTLSSQLGI